MPLYKTYGEIFYYFCENWKQKKIFLSVIFLPSFSNVYPLNFRDNESTPHPHFFHSGTPAAAAQHTPIALNNATLFPVLPTQHKFCAIFYVSLISASWLCCTTASGSNKFCLSHILLHPSVLRRFTKFTRSAFVARQVERRICCHIVWQCHTIKVP